MARLKSRTESPIGGFMFIDAPISATPLTDWGFTSIVNTVIARRRQNPRFGLPTDFNTVADQVDAQNAARMQTIKGGNYYIIDSPGDTPPPFPPAHRSGLRSVAARGENIASGVEILAEWLGEGGIPVDSSLANQRAATCKVCPKNGQGDWTSYFTKPAANIIQRQLHQKDGLELSTPDDASLGVCTACSCPLKLKVHCPLIHIVHHTRPEVMGQLVPTCWMLTEQKENS